MVKLTLTYVNRVQRTSTKTNKPFTSLSLKATEYGDNFLSGFGNAQNSNWKVGDVVEVAEVKQVQKGDKTYYNFEMPKAQNGNDPELMETLRQINFKLDTLKSYLIGVHKAVVTSDEPEYPTPESEGLDPSDMANFDH